MTAEQIQEIAIVHTIMGVEGTKYGCTMYSKEGAAYGEMKTIDAFCLEQKGFNLLFTNGKFNFNYREVWVKLIGETA